MQYAYCTYLLNLPCLIHRIFHWFAWLLKFAITGHCTAIPVQTLIAEFGKQVQVVAIAKVSTKRYNHHFDEKMRNRQLCSLVRMNSSRYLVQLASISCKMHCTKISHKYLSCTSSVKFITHKIITFTVFQKWSRLVTPIHAVNRHPNRIRTDISPNDASPSSQSDLLAPPLWVYITSSLT